MNYKLSKFIDHFTLLLLIVSIIGAIFYRFFNLEILSVYLILALSFIIYFIIRYFLKKVNKSAAETEKIAKISTNTGKKYLSIAFSFLFLGLLIFSFSTLFASRTSGSIISPWETIANYFFFLISFLAFLLVLLIFLKSKFNLLFIIFFTFLLNSIAIIIYKFGFGFDFFIHQSTMELIDATGSVDPKPFYYLGQYSLIIIIHKIFFIPIYYIHLLLVPILASILIPVNLFRVLK